MSTTSHLAAEDVGTRIRQIRGQKVLLDTDLAELYGIPTNRLNEQVRRNLNRFPPDFMFQLTDQELRRLRSQIATSKVRPGSGGRRYLPFAFTEHGALMAANAFVRLRETLASHRELKQKLEQLERMAEGLALKHDTLASDTRAKFREVIETLRQLMSPPATGRRPMGFIVPE